METIFAAIAEKINQLKKLLRDNPALNLRFEPYLEKIIANDERILKELLEKKEQIKNESNELALIEELKSELQLIEMEIEELTVYAK